MSWSWALRGSLPLRIFAPGGRIYLLRSGLRPRRPRSSSLVVANYASFASVQARKLIRRVAPPLPTKSLILRGPHYLVFEKTSLRLAKTLAVKLCQIGSAFLPMSQIRLFWLNLGSRILPRGDGHGISHNYRHARHRRHRGGQKWQSVRSSLR